METLFRDGATEFEILSELEKVKVTESDLEAAMARKLHPSQFAYAQSLYKMVMDDGDILKLGKIVESKRRVFGLTPQIVGELYHKNSLVAFGAKGTLDSLLKTIGVTYTGNIDEACKRLSSGSHKYGIILINNVLDKAIEYDVSNLVEKNIPYYKGLNKDIIDELQTIKVVSTGNKVNLSVEIHNKEFDVKSKCLYYLIETRDGKTYHFLKLPFYNAPVDSRVLLLEWSAVEAAYNKEFEKLIMAHFDKNVVLSRMSENNYDINFADMASSINNSVFDEFHDVKNTPLHEVVQFIIDKLVDYISRHVSSMAKNEIYSVLVSMKYKIKKTFYFELKDVLEREMTPIELNVNMNDKILKILSESDLFNSLYFKEKMLE